MMDKAAFSLIVRQTPRLISSARLWSHMAKDIVIWGSIIYFVVGQQNPVGWCAAAILYAAFVFRSFGMMHDCVHHAAHPNRKINDGLGELYGIFCFLPFGTWRDIHLEHHAWTGNVEKDPSMRILLQFERRGLRISKLVAMCWMYWIPLLGFMQHLVFWAPALRRRNYAFSVGVVAYLAATACLLGPALLVAGMILYLYMVEIINFPHHLGLRQHKGEARFAVYDQLQFARSCIYPKWFAHNVLLNFNLHAEHHLLPSYPWYQLDQLHEKLASSGLLKNVSHGNNWILEHRRRPIEVVFTETFKEEKRAA